MPLAEICASLNAPAVASGGRRKPAGRRRPLARMPVLRLVAAVLVALAVPGAASAMVDGGPTTLAPVAALVASPPPAPIRPVFVVSGHGWGHGIGMGQYGAYGYAQHGWDYKRILGHYYPGTTLGAAPLAAVRVLLASGTRALTVGSAGALKVVDGTGKARRLPAGSYPRGPGL